MRRLFLALCLILCTAGVFASPCTYSTDGRHDETNIESVMRADSTTETVFYFKPKTSMFFYEGNDEPIRRAGELITRWRKEIDSGEMYVMVNGYCSSFRTEYSNYKMAKLRSSQVKSYYITNFGLKEENYITNNYTTPYKGDKDIVAVFRLVRVSELDSLRNLDAVGAAAYVAADNDGETEVYFEEDSTESENEGEDVEAESGDVPDTSDSQQSDLTSEPVTDGESVTGDDTFTSDVAATTEADGTDREALLTPGREKTRWEDSRWRVKTNLPAWALVVTNLAAEYRFSEHWSAELPVYFSAWTISNTYRFRTFSTQPSVRYWLSPEWKGHFFGVHLTAGQFNISTDSKFRYQDANGMYGMGFDYGYAMKFSEKWGLEFNIGAGLIHTKYNVYYNIRNGARFDTRIKNYWGITRVGISLIYTIK